MTAPDDQASTAGTVMQRYRRSFEAEIRLTSMTIASNVELLTSLQEHNDEPSDFFDRTRNNTMDDEYGVDSQHMEDDDRED